MATDLETGRAEADGLPCIETWMQWAGEIKGRARVDIADWSRSNITLEKHDVRICDARPIREHLSLDREGFTLAEDGNRLASDCDLEAEGAGYLSAVAETVKALSGADFVLPQGKGMLKRYAERAKIDGAIPPSRWAHMDYTGFAARKWVEWIEGWEGRELRHYPRFAIYQTWRVLSPPPQDNTLVLCDASTIDPDDQIVFDAAIREPFDEPGNQFESQLCRYRPEQSWYYFPDMTADELIVWKGFDSDPVKDAQPLHNSADIPGLPDTAPRCSVEARFFAFFDSPH